MTSSKKHGALKTILLAMAPALFMLISPYWLALLNPLGATVVLSAYYLVEAILLFAILLFVAKREGMTVGAVIAYNKPVSMILFIALAALGAAYAIYMRDYLQLPGLRAFSMSLMQAMPGWPSIFGRLPQHDHFFDSLGAAGAPLSLIFGALAVGIASMMQSLYFRGFLLSRLEHLGIGAPIIITLLFVVFHLGAPFFWPQFLLLTAIWAFIAYFTKNVWIVVVSHVIMNTYTQILMLGSMALGLE